MRLMNLKQLETFYWVCQLGNFQAAADRLNTTQPGVSTRISDLEQALGAQLFDRSGRSARLTVRGRELVTYAARMLELSDDIRRRIGNRSSITGLIRLGVADTIAMTWLPELVAELARQFPELGVELEVDLTVNLLALLRDHKIDIAFLVGPVPGPDLASEMLWSVPLAWMAHPSIALPEGPLDAACLAHLPIISHTRGSHHHLMIERWFREQGQSPKRISSCNSLAILIRLVTSQLGLSVLAPTTVKKELAERQLRIVPTVRPVPWNNFVAAYPASTLQPAVQEVAHLAREIIDRLQSTEGDGDADGRRLMPDLSAPDALPRIKRVANAVPGEVAGDGNDNNDHARHQRHPRRR
jgi:DNA-binding transcriptional LysR family regulator